MSRVEKSTRMERDGDIVEIWQEGEESPLIIFDASWSIEEALIRVFEQGRILGKKQGKNEYKELVKSLLFA